MSRELQSDPVSSVDRSSSQILEERPAVQLQHESVATASASAAGTTVAESIPTDDPVINDPSSVSNESSSVNREDDATSGVRIVGIFSIRHTFAECQAHTSTHLLLFNSHVIQLPIMLDIAKSRSSLLAPAHPSGPGKRARKTVVVVVTSHLVEPGQSG